MSRRAAGSGMPAAPASTRGIRCTPTRRPWWRCSRGPRERCMAGGDRFRRLRRAALVGSVAVLLLMIACWPTSRFVGVNHIVSRQTLPLWVKAVDFIDRDLNLARTAHAVLGDTAGDDAKAAAALAWTRANIRNTPGGMPFVDDHVW